MVEAVAVIENVSGWNEVVLLTVRELVKDEQMDGVEGNFSPSKGNLFENILPSFSSSRNLLEKIFPSFSSSRTC